MMRVAALLLLGSLPVLAQQLLFEAEWHLMHAGDATMAWQDREATLHLETAGMAGSLYKVNDDYTVQFDKSFCAATSVMKSEEGKKKLEVRTTYNRKPGKVETVEHDLRRDVLDTKEIEAPPCVHDVIAGLARLRSMRMEPGAAIELPLTNGKKAASVRVEAQQREKVSTPAGTFQAIRHEAFLYNGVLYRRKAKLYFWLTDDSRRLPVQIRIEMGFFLGTVTLRLAKEDKS